MDASRTMRVSFASVLVIAAGIAAARPDYSYTGPVIPIPDGTGSATPGAPASVTISVPDATTIVSLTCAVYIPHGFQGDLVLTLTHVETGHTATLIDRPYVPQTPLGFPATDYGTASQFFLLDDAAAALYDAPAVTPPGVSSVSGAWKPQSALAVFSGESTLGMWRLTATDNAGGDTGSIAGFKLSMNAGTGCYANCDGSTAVPFLNILDFSCFINKFAALDTYANCDASTAPPVLNILDFSCFINKFAAGCSAP